MKPVRNPSDSRMTPVHTLVHIAPPQDAPKLEVL